MEEIKKRRGVKKGKFTRKEKSLRDAITQRKSSEVIELLWKEVCNSFDEVQDLNEELQCLVDSDEGSKECDQYIAALEKTKSELYELVLKKKSKDKKESETLVKIKKVDPPKFSGRLRYYPNWKKEFKKYVVPVVGESTIYLRSALEKDSEPYKLVEGLDDYDRMFKRLDDKYGDTQKLIECILSDIDKLKPVQECEHDKLIQLIDVVENVFIE